MGNNATCTVVGIGSIKLKLNDGTEKILTKVRHVPDLKRNLISLGTLEEAGFSFKAESSMLKVMKGVRVVMKGNKKNGLYVLKGCAVTGISSSVSKTNVSKSSLWNQRLGHISERGLQELEKQGLLCGDKVEGLEFCEHCIYGKQTRVKFNTGIHKTKGKLDYIHSYLWGPSKVPSHGGNRYFITFIDDFSRKVWIYLLKTKDEAFNTFVQWKTRVENQCDKRIKVLRIDNGHEYCGDEFNKFCKTHGIYRNNTVRKTPQQNGLAERMNRTILERVRCMLSQAGLTKQFWGEAVHTACYLINRSPSAALEYKTPQEIWNGSPVDYSVLKIFGCPAYYHINEGKLEPRARKGLFMGYPEGVKGFRIWCNDSRKCIISRDVTFHEAEMFKDQHISTCAKDAESSSDHQLEVEL